VSNDARANSVAWLRDAGVTEISPFGERVAELLGVWLAGIYHYHGAAKLDWSNDAWFELRSHQALSTFDNQSLTRLVFLAHDLALRVEISPLSHQNLMIRIHPREHGPAEFHKRHPTIEQALAAWRERTMPVAPPAADRELLAARQLIRLLRDALMDCGEHSATCERAMELGGDCACGLDLAIGLACDFEPPEVKPLPLYDATPGRAAEAQAARVRLFGPTEGHL